LQNRDKGARKEVLASWTSKALSRALIVANIEAGFRKIGIYPLNPWALNCLYEGSRWRRELRNS
jgi:hypothetical protein